MNETVEIKRWVLLLLLLTVLITTFNNTYTMLKKPTSINIHLMDGSKSK